MRGTKLVEGLRYRNTCPRPYSKPTRGRGHYLSRGGVLGGVTSRGLTSSRHTTRGFAPGQSVFKADPWAGSFCFIAARPPTVGRVIDTAWAYFDGLPLAPARVVSRPTRPLRLPWTEPLQCGESGSGVAGRGWPEDP